MTSLLRVFFRICLMRDRPQDLPAVGMLLAFCIAVYFLSGVLVAWPGRGLGEAILVSLVDTPLLLLCTGLLLMARSHLERWLQTVTALTGTGMLFNLLAMPFVFFVNSNGLSVDGASGIQSLIGYLILFLLCWNVSVIGFVYKHALNMSFTAALIIAVSCVGLSVYLINLMVIGDP